MSILGRLRNWLLGRPALAPRTDLSPSDQRSAAHDGYECGPVTLSLPRLPRAIAGPVVKRRRTDATYLVDLAAWSCTCPYAAARVTRYAERDVRRVCKHLSRLALNRIGVLSACDPPVAALLQRGVWSKKRRYSRVTVGARIHHLEHLRCSRSSRSRSSLPPRFRLKPRAPTRGVLTSVADTTHVARALGASALVEIAPVSAHESGQTLVGDEPTSPLPLRRRNVTRSGR